MRALPLLLLALCACGELADPARPRVLTTLRGTLSSATPFAASAEVRVSLLWFAEPPGRLEQPGEVSYTAAQDVAVTPSFPASFSVALDTPPPASVMVRKDQSIAEIREWWPDGARWALGALIAYEDVNGNGVLDLIDEDAVAGIDRVVATSSVTLVAYLENGLPRGPALAGTPRLGYNLLAVPACFLDPITCATPGSIRVLPAEASITLKVTSDPRLSRVMCRTSRQDSERITHAEGEVPSSAGADLADARCTDGGRTFTSLNGCRTVRSLCFGEYRRCRAEVWRLADSGEVRRRWPCEIDGWCDASSDANPCPVPDPPRVLRVPWVLHAGGSGGVELRGVATSTAGDLWIAGTHSGALDIGGRSFSARGPADLFLARVTPAGSVAWARSEGGPDEDGTSKIAVDARGNLSVTGWIGRGVDLGAGPLAVADAADVFVARYAPDGALTWAKAIAGAGQGDAGGGVAASSGGGTVAALMAGGALDLGGTTAPEAPGVTMAVASYGPTGALLWSRVLPGAGGGWLSDLAAGGATTYLAGRFHGTRDLGGGALSTGSDSINRIALAAYGEGGAYRWARTWGGSGGYENAHDVAVVPGGDVVVTGAFRAALEPGGPVSAGATDVFVVRLHPDGSVAWTRRFGGPLDDAAETIAAAPDGTIVLAGSFGGRATFGGEVRVTHGHRDAFIAALSPDGALRWVETWGGAGDDVAWAEVDGAGHVRAAIAFSGEVTIGTRTFSSAGLNDVALAELVP